MASGVLMQGEKIFVQRREDEGIWGGLWEFPGGCLEPGEGPEEAVVREWAEETGFVVDVDRALTVIRHGYTRYRVTLHAFALRFADGLPAPGPAKGLATSPDAEVNLPAPPQLTEATDWAWVTLKELSGLPLPAPHRKLADLLTVGANKDSTK